MKKRARKHIKVGLKMDGLMGSASWIFSLSGGDTKVKHFVCGKAGVSRTGVWKKADALVFRMAARIGRNRS